MSQKPDFLSRVWVAGAPAHDRYPKHIAPDPYAPSCGCWAYGKVGLRRFFGLCPAESRRQRLGHQALACVPQPQAWLQGGATVTPVRATSSFANQLTTPSARLSTMGLRAFSRSAPRLWNSLPADIRNSPKNTSAVDLPSGDTVEGDSVTLSCSSDANPPVLSYSWFKQSAAADTLLTTGQNYSISNISSQHSGLYYCTAHNQLGHHNSTPTQLDVLYSPKNTRAVVLPSGDTVEGDSVTLSCSSDANPPVLSYSWFKQSAAADTLLTTGQSYSISYISSQHSGLYYCTVHNQLGHRNSTPTQLDVLVLKNTVLMFIMVGLFVFLALTLIPGALWMWKRKRSSANGHSSTGENGQPQSDAVYENISASNFSRRVASGDQDDVRYVSVIIKRSPTQEVSLSPRHPPDTTEEEDVQYATVNVSRSTAAIHWPCEILRENKELDPKRWPRGKRAGVSNRLRDCAHRTPLPSILLANIESLENKLDDLRARVKFQRDIRDCNLLCFIETWLNPAVPDHAIQPAEFFSSKRCSSHTLLYTQPGSIDYRMSPFFPSSGVYIGRNQRCLYSTTSGHGHCLIRAAKRHSHSTGHDTGTLIVAGDFNSANLKRAVPNFYQHITCPTRAERTLDHCYTTIKDGYKAQSHPPFGKSDHAAIFLMPNYKQRLKQEVPAEREVMRWLDQLVAALQDTLNDADWDMFRRSSDDINVFTGAVVGFIGELADDTVQKMIIRTLPNQKPRVDKTIHDALRSRAAAYNAGLASGGMDSYKAASYNVRKAVKEAKQHYGRKLVTAPTEWL
ncbi:hypothetical protein QTP70_001183 [Hemibagrus guttatus]|uniref:Ig-like domain-containing protein n=1 Tax=Hemibagrus guttatus TaxID=175788 RepID=A0AAE0UKH7_9TELE|nr:hypothetical protein QTP70_001183 [Hemibagrus guttatus]